MCLGAPFTIYEIFGPPKGDSDVGIGGSAVLSPVTVYIRGNDKAFDTPTHYKVWDEVTKNKEVQTSKVEEMFLNASNIESVILGRPHLAISQSDEVKRILHVQLIRKDINDGAEPAPKNKGEKESKDAHAGGKPDGKPGDKPESKKGGSELAL